jgi:hypothetical protein
VLRDQARALAGVISITGYIVMGKSIIEYLGSGIAIGLPKDGGAIIANI